MKLNADLFHEYSKIKCDVCIFHTAFDIFRKASFFLFVVIVMII